MTSPYPELKALSKESRAEMLDNEVDGIRDELCVLGSLFLCDLDTIAIVQSHLDRIKQLVLTRGKDEK